MPNLTDNLFAFLSIDGREIPAERLPYPLRYYVESYVSAEDDAHRFHYSEAINREVARGLGLLPPEREEIHEIVGYDS
jgi:hypothetical protein